MLRKLLFYFTLLISTNTTFSQKVDFSHLGLEQGLSQTNVKCMVQDKHGYMWFGTEDGLNRYDGESFQVFKHLKNDSLSISDNFINTLYKDKDNNIWAGTQTGGLNKFDYKTGKWKRIKGRRKNVNTILSICVNKQHTWIGTDNGIFSLNIKDTAWLDSFPKVKVMAIQSIDDDNLLVATSKGVFRIDTNEKEFKKINIKINFSYNNNIEFKSIVKNKDNNFFIGSKSGLFFYDVKNNSIKKDSIVSSSIESLLFDDTGVLWIGTLSDGLKRYNIKAKELKEYRYKPEIENSLNNNNILSIYQSQSGLIWVGTEIGINRYNKNKQQFHTFRKETNLNSLNSNIVWSFYEGDKILWVGTDEGINRYNIDSQKWNEKPYKVTSKNSASNGIRVLKISYDKKFLWVGTKKGLFKFNLSTKKYVNVPYPLSDRFVKAIHIDKDGLVWVGTWENGVYTYNIDTENITPFHKVKEGESSSDSKKIFTFHEVSNGDIWAGTYGGGLVRYNKKNEKKDVFIKFSGDEEVKFNSAMSIIESDSTYLWVGTVSDGLLKFDIKKGKYIKQYTEKNGLPDNMVYGIEMDDKGNLWLSTNNGLSKFNIKTEVFLNYNKYNGIQANEFNAGSHFKNKNGKLFFGGVNGFTAFIPDSIKRYNEKASIHVTSVLVNDKEVLDNSNYKIDRGFKFNSDEKIKIFFTSLDNAIPENVKYKYTLIKDASQDQDTLWKFTPKQQGEATFSNKDSGKYELIIKSTNSDGSWNNNKNRVLKVIVNKSVFLSWWFYVIIFLFLSSIGTLAYSAIKRKINIKRKEEFDLELDNKTKELKDQNNKLIKAYNELEEIKNKMLESEQFTLMGRLISGISHEINTPIGNGAMGASHVETQINKLKKIYDDEKMSSFEIEDFFKKTLESIKIVRKNLDRANKHMKGLQIISRDQESEKAREFVFYDYLQSIIFNLKHEWKYKKVQWNISCNEKMKVNSYPGAISQIFTNLIINSVRHGFAERTNCKIDIDVKRHTNTLLITYRDNGNGIEKKNIKKIFKAFESFSKHPGSGLGLNIVKNLVDNKFNGKISCDSKVKQYTQFRIQLEIML